MMTWDPPSRSLLSAVFLAIFVVSGAEGVAQTGPSWGEWPAYRGDLGSTRYSPLDQIDASNVGELQIAWRWSARNFGPRPEANYRTTPLMVDGVLFATAGYVTSQMSPNAEGLLPAQEGMEVDYMLMPGQPMRVDGLPAVKPPCGQISAIDLSRGEMLWQIANSDTPEEIANHPALMGVELPRTGRPARVGLLATRTVLFAGEGVGGKPVLRAHDKATAEVLAEIALPAPQTGLPMSYMLEGTQYVVVAVGSRDAPAELVALTLP